MKLLRKFVPVFDRVVGLFASFSGILLLSAMIIVCVGIIARKVGHPIGWVIEFCCYILVYITFLLAAWVLRQEAHVKIDIVFSRFSSRAQCLVNATTSAICAIACSVLVWYGVKVTWDLFQSGYLTVSVLIPAPPLYIFVAVIPVGLLLLVIQLVRRTYDNIRHLKTSPHDEQGARMGKQPGL